ncbi:hypothetical protein CH372_18470 [Leptospira meyeri]|nr:hypothetical protein CH372_18470 [Leptospira meyeri]PKA23692.1 hypothetical protein CH381_24275 [Leptospira sp. mixed culture ATI2-C-A1]
MAQKSINIRKIMLISDTKKYIQANFHTEDELEKVVLNNYEYIFGLGSFYLPKKLIKTNDGAGTIPDGFAIDLINRNWFIVEVELLRHSVWNHIAPQISKQIIASQQNTTKKLILELAVIQYKENESVKEIFNDFSINEIDVRKILTEIIDKKPLIGLPIDNTSNDLEDWARTLNVNVKLWTIKKYVDFEDANNIIFEFPEEYKPILDTEEEAENENESKIKSYDVTLNDLISAGFLKIDERITMNYKPKNGIMKTYTGIIQKDGSILLLGYEYSSLSYAALAGMQDAGSQRKTVNGWTSWKNENGIYMSELRQKFIETQK